MEQTVSDAVTFLRKLHSAAPPTVISEDLLRAATVLGAGDWQ